MRQVTIALSREQRDMLVTAVSVFHSRQVSHKARQEAFALFMLINSPNTDIDAHVSPLVAEDYRLAYKRAMEIA